MWLTKLYQHTAGVFRMEEDDQFLHGTYHRRIHQWPEALTFHTFDLRVDVIDCKGHMMGARPALLQKFMDRTLLILRAQQFDLGIAQFEEGHIEMLRLHAFGIVRLGITQPLVHFDSFIHIPDCHANMIDLFHVPKLRVLNIIYKWIRYKPTKTDSLNCKKMIYLDYNSTTPIDERVLEAMMPYLTDKFGNASSITHRWGWLAKDGVERAWEQVATALNCTAQEITFTSGATESVNLAMKGVFQIYKRKGNHIITCTTEHKAVMDTCKSLEKAGARITYLEVDSNGLIDLDALKKEISDNTILVSIMYVNNETGVIQPMDEIAEIVHAHKSILMSDATQAVGKIPIDLQEQRIDLLAFSAHKFYGPKGVGGLYTRRRDPRVILAPQIEGGGHQRGLRSGTLNVPGIVGLGEALQLSTQEFGDARIEQLRNELENAMLAMDSVMINGSRAPRLYNTSNICFQGIRAEDIIRAIKGSIAVSMGSACTAEDQQPSHVLQAMGLSDSDTFSSIRFSLGRFNTSEEISEVTRVLSNHIKALREKP